MTIELFQHLPNPIGTRYPSPDRLEKGVYEEAVGIMRFVTELIEPALLKE